MKAVLFLLLLGSVACSTPSQSPPAASDGPVQPKVNPAGARRRAADAGEQRDAAPCRADELAAAADVREPGRGGPEDGGAGTAARDGVEHRAEPGVDPVQAAARGSIPWDVRRVHCQGRAGRRQFQFSNHAQVAATNATRWTGQNAYSTSLGPRQGVELGEVDDLLKQTLVTLDENRQKELWRRVGDARFEAIQEVPLFWLPVEVVADPKIVEDWVFPGSISGSWSHVDLIKAAR